MRYQNKMAMLKDYGLFAVHALVWAGLVAGIYVLIVIAFS